MTSEERVILLKKLDSIRCIVRKIIHTKDSSQLASLATRLREATDEFRDIAEKKYDADS